MNEYIELLNSIADDSFNLFKSGLKLFVCLLPVLFFISWIIRFIVDLISIPVDSFLDWKRRHKQDNQVNLDEKL